MRLMYNSPPKIFPYKWVWLSLTLLLGLVGAMAHRATPPSEAAVELISFTATATNNNSEVRLRWETAVEMDTAGYRLQRSDLGDTFITVTYLDEDVSFIPGDPTGLGAIYIAQDTAVTTGNTYIYTLIEIDNSSGQEEIATAVVNLGGGNSQPTNTPTATNTPTPTATGIVNLAPTNTPTPRTQASPTQTNTPPPPTATTPPTPVPTTASTNTSTTANNDNGTTNNSNSGGNNSSTNNTTTGSNNSSTNTGASVAQASETQQEATPSTSSNSDNNTPTPDTPEEEAEEEAREETNDTPDLTQPDDDTAPSESSPYPENDNTGNDPAGYQEGQPLEQQPTVTSESSENVVPLGAGNNQNNNTQPNASTTSTNDSDNSNNWILWGAFLGALAIFIAGIAGSILLFMRRR